MRLLLPFLILAGLATNAPGQEYPPRAGKFGISVKAGPAIPVAPFSDTFGIGFTGFVDVPYNLTENLQIYLGTGFSRFNIDNGKLAEELPGETVTSNVDAPYLVIPVVLGINYSYRYKSFWPYFTVSIGIYFQKLESSGSVTTNGLMAPLLSHEQTWSQDAFAVGLGSLIPLGNEGWAVDLNAKYNAVVNDAGVVLITTSPSNSFSTRAVRYVSVLGGLSYTFR
ncbi:MAG TPA: outer membrane beta-barrel protein [Bacteroidota bacterium]|nr:outer membrane beta-barrel protein [Bacteroidota bacterium]